MIFVGLSLTYFSHRCAYQSLNRNMKVSAIATSILLLMGISVGSTNAEKICFAASITDANSNGLPPQKMCDIATICGLDIIIEGTTCDENGTRRLGERDTRRFTQSCCTCTLCCCPCLNGTCKRSCCGRRLREEDEVLEQELDEFEHQTLGHRLLESGTLNDLGDPGKLGCVKGLVASALGTTMKTLSVTVVGEFST